jgi:alkylhydroperoxidase/carboxymuconolactone decarboxylase family protein YurZ
MTATSGFQLFGEQQPEVAAAFGAYVQAHASASALADKTQHLAYLGVLAAQRMTGGLPFHVRLAFEAGAGREEVSSAVLVGMPAVGLVVLDALPVALAAWDEAAASRG